MTTAVTITGLAAGGDGIGRLGDGRVVFCEGALPGETVAVDIVEERRDYARALTVGVEQASALRVAPPCPNVARGCGGCPWQHVDPASQPSLKRDIVADALRRIAHVEIAVELAPAAVPPTGYRTTARLGVGPDGRPAYHRRRSHDLVAVDECPAAHPLLAEMIAAVRVPGARAVTLRVSAATGERVVVASPGRAPRGAAIHERAAGRSWRVSATSFFQSGPDAATLLADEVRAATGPAPGTVADLYAGVGLLGGSVGAARVVAVESHRGAAGDAAANLAAIAHSEGLDAEVVCAEVADVAPLDADVVIADPARSGLGPSAARAVAAWHARRVVLVSCDPASMARDVGLLAAEGYALHSVRVLDLFPGTFHVETVGIFEHPQ